MDTIAEFLEAVKAGDRARVEELVALYPEVKRTNEGVSALMLSIYYGKSEITDYLLAQKQNLDIFEAAATGKVGQVISLIDVQPNRVNQFSPDGFTPLGLAAFFGQPEVVKVLLEKGATVNLAANNAQKVAPLHSAVAGKHMSIVEMLIKAGADVNAAQEGGFTPLHGAVENGMVEMIALLLTFGANRDATSANGKTLIMAKMIRIRYKTHVLLFKGGMCEHFYPPT
jgi:uncharacterized protein